MRAKHSGGDKVLKPLVFETRKSYAKLDKVMQLMHKMHEVHKGVKSCSQ